ncbi:MAG: PKD domain-containing protein [Deltaproteobacteria bacterium]|nr:PKD domain-containing protein [Deltaproteobacteria bacterium]
MKKVLFVLIVLSCFVAFSPCHAQEYWDKAFMERASTILKSCLTDNGFLLAGIVHDYDFDQEVSFTELRMRNIDSAGEIVWQKIIGDRYSEQSLNFMAQTGDGGFLITGAIEDTVRALRDIYIMKLDRYGNAQWRSSLGDSASDAEYSYTVNVIETRDGEYVTWGDRYHAATDTWDNFIVRLDAQGEVKWTQSLKDSLVIGIVPTGDGGCFVNGVLFDVNNGLENEFLLKMGSAGAVAWQKEITVRWNYNHVFQPTPDGGCVLIDAAYGIDGGQLIVIQVDDAGALVTGTAGGAQNDTLELKQVARTADGGHVFVGSLYEKAADIWKSIAIKIDSHGMIVWQRFLGNTSEEFRVHTVGATYDGGCFVMGRPYDQTAVSWNWLIVQLDAQGNVQWQKTVGGDSSGYEVAALMTRAAEDGYYLYGRQKNVYDYNDADMLAKLNENLAIPECGVIPTGIGIIAVTDAPFEVSRPISVLKDSALVPFVQGNIVVTYDTGITVQNNVVVADVCKEGIKPKVTDAQILPCGLSFMVECPLGIDVGTTQQHITIKNSSGEIVHKDYMVQEFDEGRTLQVSFEEMGTDTYIITVIPYAVDGTAGDTYAFEVIAECGGQAVPVLAAPENLYVDSSSSQLSFDIQNAGEGILEWSLPSTEYLDDQEAWVIMIAPISGETRMSSTVTVNIDGEGLPAGTYRAQLNIESNGGDQALLLTLTVMNTLGAHFSGCGSQDEVPWGLQFVDESTGDVVAWEWRFGDGGSSYEQNPFYTYYEAGVYTVSLMVTDANGLTDTVVKNECVRAGDCSVDAGFVSNPKEGQAPLAVRFTDQSEGPVAVYAWDFGDGGTSEQQHPEHTYHTPGMYTVTLMVKGAGCSSTETKTNLILVEPSRPGSILFCPLMASLSGMPRSQGYLKVLRDFRDQRLSTSLTGKLLAGLYYASAEEVNVVIAQDDDLKTEIGSLVINLAPRVKAVVDGRSTVITQAELCRIKNVLNRLADNGGAVMRMTVRYVLDEIEQEAFLQQYGIVLIED